MWSGRQPAGAGPDNEYNALWGDGGDYEKDRRKG